MKTQHTTYLYAFTGGGTPALKLVEEPLVHGTPPNSLHAGGKTYLIGAFSAAIGETGIPVSPTLKLNGDLGTCTEPQLQAIAAAELTRMTGSSWSSRIVDADNRVTVLGSSADQLSSFIDTYGGVLQIEPLLLSGYHPEYATATELEITRTSDRLTLNYQVRRPVDINRCTYCGACGPVCPVDCLAPSLFLDLDRCTFCNACVDACPQEAIHLHSAELYQQEPQALLLLDDVRVDLPENRQGIWTSDRLPEFFASIYAREIEETVQCNRTICQYDARLDLGCDRCLLVCRHGAISATRDGIAVDQFRCVECGECIGACPTGAMQLMRFPDRSFLDYLAGVDIQPGWTVVLGHEEQLQRFWWRHRTSRFPGVLFIEYPVPEALTAMHLLSMLTAGAAGVIVLTSGGSAVKTAAVQVNTICEALFARPDAVVLETGEEIATRLAKGPGPPLLKPMKNNRLENRRQRLAELLFHSAREAGQTLRLTGNSFADFGEIICDRKRCTLCLACLNVCHVESLSGDAANFALLHAPARCIQCGGCVAICPEQALSQHPGLRIDGQFLATKELTRTPQMTCAGCGKIFGTRKSYERVMEVLAEKNMLDQDSDLFAYCDQCRVIKLYERNQ